MSHSTAVQFQESLKIYPKKRVQIQRINISRSQIILQVLKLFTVGLNRVAPRVLRWGLQCKHPADLIGSQLPAYFSGTQVYTVHGGLASIRVQGKFQSIKKKKKKSSGFTFHWHWSVRFLSCCWAGWSLALADIQQMLEEKVKQPFIRCKSYTPTWRHTFNIWPYPARSATGWQIPLMIILKLCQANRQERDAKSSWGILPV